MTDRELLELAAKAACVNVQMKKKWKSGYCSTVVLDSHMPHFLPELELPWDPLHDDGTALRLLGALNLNISFSSTPEGAQVSVYPDYDLDFEYPHTAEPFSIKNRAQAIRRCIVRAAASIAQSMNQETPGREEK